MPIVFQNGKTKIKLEECNPDLNLLAHAQMIELDIGSVCGGHGICGKDRVQVKSSFNESVCLSPLTDEEKKHLTKEEINQGMRLACQCFPGKKEQKLELTYFKYLEIRK